MTTDPTRTQCVICGKQLELVHVNNPFQPYGGGDVAMTFCFGSAKFDRAPGVTKYTGLICDECALPLTAKCECNMSDMDGKPFSEADAIPAPPDAVGEGEGVLIERSGQRLLLCDCCGAIHRDDEAALSESCKCGRFKQRMEWLKLSDLVSLTAELSRLQAEREASIGPQRAAPKSIRAIEAEIRQAAERTDNV